MIFWSSGFDVNLLAVVLELEVPRISFNGGIRIKLLANFPLVTI
jgi:hypothetical protein